jgi:hypothetical protein
MQFNIYEISKNGHKRFIFDIDKKSIMDAKNDMSVYLSNHNECFKLILELDENPLVSIWVER